jgi:hypothetical protein
LLTRLTIVRLMGVLVALAIAVPLAACGGDSAKDDYKKQAQDISSKLKTDVEATQAKINSGDKAQQLAGIREFKTVLTNATDKLDALKPPEDYKGVHDKLVGELRKVAADVQAVGDAIEAQDSAAAQTAAQKLQTDIQGMQQAGDEFDKKVK